MEPSSEKGANVDSLVLLFHSFKSDLATIGRVLDECSEYWAAMLVLDERTAKGRLVEMFVDAGVSLINSLDSFVGRFEQSYQERGLTPASWQAILNARDTLREVVRIAPRSDLPFELRALARDVIDALAGFQAVGAKLHRQTVKELRFAALQISGLSCYYDLLQAKKRLEDVRNRIRESLEPDRGSSSNPISDGVEFDAIVGEITTRNAPLGAAERIYFRPALRCPGLRVLATREQLLLCLDDLFLNALKYSHRLPYPEQSWIDVKTARKGDWLELRIENWGKPITQVELSSGILFDHGFRGEFVRDSIIPGTGVGLHRTRDGLVRLGGSIRLESRPAGPSQANDDYLGGPFLTTTIVRLPMAGASRGSR